MKSSRSSTGPTTNRSSATCELNESFHAKMLAIARSPMLERALDGILSLPFGGPSAFVMTEAELPESRAILLIAYHHHQALVEAVEDRQSGRAESLAREHARVALKNLEIVLRHGEVLERLPGASLITLPTGSRRRFGGDGRAMSSRRRFRGDRGAVNSRCRFRGDRGAVNSRCRFRGDRGMVSSGPTRR